VDIVLVQEVPNDVDIPRLDTKVNILLELPPRIAVEKIVITVKVRLKV
jgi:hypothetical protein